MATFKECIYKILQDDAKLNEAGKLGALLGHYSTAPYGIFFSHPPEEPDLPLVTYFISAQTGRFPRSIFVNLTAWGDNFEAAQNRIYALLHNASIVSTDFKTLMLKWDWAGPELFGDDLKCYYQQVRYLYKAIKL